MNTCRKACSNVSIKALVAFFVAVFAVVVLSGCASQSYTPEKKQSILSATALHTDGVLRVGVDASSAPYAAQSQGDIMGIDVDIAQAVCDKLGYELKIEDMEFDAIVNSVKSGKADFGVAGMTVTEDRKKSVDFTDPYTTAEQVVIVKK